MLARSHLWLECLVLLSARVSRALLPCYPDQWEGTIEVLGVQMGEASQYYTQGRVQMAYDFMNTFQATNETFEMNGEKFSISILMDYEGETVYEVKDGVCTKTLLPYAMTRTCVPDGAVSTGSFTLGVLNLATPVTAYSYNISEGTWGYYYYAPTSVKMNPWVPVAEIRQAGLKGATAMTTSSYINVTLGINDISVFKPPPQCRHVQTLPHHKQKFLHPSTSKKILSGTPFVVTGN